MSISPSLPIRVMLVDDHTMVRRGLAAFLRVFEDTSAGSFIFRRLCCRHNLSQITMLQIGLNSAVNDMVQDEILHHIISRKKR